MLDVTIGPVTSVIDGNTFTMRVLRIGTHNKFSYYDNETVRVANTTAHSLNTFQGMTERQNLHNLIHGKTVRCKIHFRNDYNVLIADVEIL